MKRTKGSQSEAGMIYQYGVTTLLASQLSKNNQVDDYIIYSSEKSAGKFDDIIARIKLKDEDDWYLYLIQVKYKDNKRLNVSDNLKGKRIEYFLSDYIQCFNDILGNPDLACRRGIPDDNIKFSIFCNKGIQTPVFLRQDCTFHLNLCRYCEKTNEFNKVLSPFGDKYWKFACKDLENSRFQNFFDDCHLYLEQPNFNKLNELIGEACQTKNTKAIINYVKDYFNDDDLYKQGLRKEVFETELQIFRLVEDIPPITSLADLVDDNLIAIWNEITMSHDITAVNHTHNFATESCLYGCLIRKVNSLLDVNIDWKTCGSKINVLDDEVTEKFLTYSKTKRLRYWIDPPATLRLLLIELWKCGDLPLILETHTRLSNFERYAHLKRSYIILDDWTNRSEEINNSNLDVFTSLSSIAISELQDRMLEATVVSPQGRKPMTLKNLLRDDEELMATFTCTNMLKMMSKRTPFLKDGYCKGVDYLAFIIEDEECSEISDRIEPYAIGHNFRVTCPSGRTNECIEIIRGHTDISQHYTIYNLRKTGEKLVLTQGDPRNLNHRFVDQYEDPLFISSTGEYIPIIGQTIDLNELQYIPRQLRRVTLPRSFFSLQETQICVVSGDVDVIEGSIELSNLDDLLNKTILIGKKTYFVKIHRTEDLRYYWQKLCHLQYPILDIYIRNGRFELLRYKNCKHLSCHISYDGGIYSEQDFFNEIKDEPNELAVVTGDAGIGKSSFLKWLCSNYSTQDYIIFYDLLNLQVDLNKSERQRVDLIDFIFEESQKGLPKQYIDFVSDLRRKKKLIWILDSFDEIRLACEKEVLDLIGVIANSGAQIVIATRNENCQILMEQFEIRLIKIEPLQEQDCLSYWALDQTLLKNVSSELVTNPLYLNFLKMISANREELEKITKYTLYEKVINMKVKHCLRTTYQILDDCDIQRAVLLLENLALVALFGKEIIEKELYWVCNNEVSDMTKFGIVIRFDEDNCPIFCHRSFVEFLFAQWIAKACRINTYKSPAKYLYRQIVNENKLHILNILFEDEELHRAILQLDITRIEEIIKQDSGYWNSVDKLGRTALHAAVIYCWSSNLPSAVLNGLDVVVTSMLERGLDTNKPDMIMNWNWSEYMRADILYFMYSSKKMEVMRIYLQLHRRKVEEYNCPSSVFPTKFFYLLFQWASDVGTIDMISDLLLLQNVENKIFYNFYQVCLGLLPENNLQWTESFRFEGQLTPLHVACIYGSVSLIQHLIEIGADVNATDMFGCTPIYYCMIRCSLSSEGRISQRDQNINALKLLLEAGACPNSSCKDSYKRYLLYLGVQTKDINVVRMLIKANAFIYDSCDNHTTLLHLAVSLGCIDIARFLLQCGFPWHLKNEQNQTPLDIALEQNHTEMIELLSKKEDISDIKAVEIGSLYMSQMTYPHDGNKLPYKAIVCDNIDLSKNVLPVGECVNVPDKYGFTPLHLAIAAGNIEACTILLNKGADILVKDKRGLTPLFAATLFDNITVVEMILAKGDSTNIADFRQVTPLHIAVSNNNLRIVKLLLEKGANPNAKDMNGITPFHEAVLNGFEDIVAVLLESGADLEMPREEGSTPLHVSITRGHRKISELLLRKGANVHSRNDHDWTPFITAVREQDVDMVRLILENGANVSDTFANGYTATICASFKRNIELLRLLIEKGADINAQDASGFSVLAYAAQSKEINVIKLLLQANVHIDRKGGTYALSCCIVEGDINTIRLLLKRGACVNNFDDRYRSTPLHLAIAKGDADIINLLLENGANINAKCDGGTTILVAAIETRNILIVELLLKAYDNYTKEAKLEALRCAISTGDIEIIKLLLNKGVDLNTYNKNSFTPLHLAIQKKRADIVGLVLENGADVNIPSKNGLPPFVKAVLDGHIEITRLLLDNGANINVSFEGLTALHFKSGRGDVDFVKLLIEKGADVNMRAEDGTTALEIAVRCGYTNIVDVLRKGRTDRNTQTLTEESDLPCSSRKGNVEENNSNTQNEFQIGIFYWAAIKGDLQKIKASLDDGVNINFQNSNGSTALHVAVMNNEEDIVQTLLERGADVNLKTNDGFTPLCLAKLKGYTSIADLLSGFMLSLSAV